MSKASNLAGFVPSIEPTNNLTVGNIVGTAATFTGNVTVGGTLTYEDVTNIDSIGIVTARAGIVLGPTANTIQLGTGTTISSPASDTFTILTGGSERVRVDSSGRLAIGTSSPATHLHLTSSTLTDNVALRIQRSSSATSPSNTGLQLNIDGVNYGKIYASSTGALTFAGPSSDYGAFDTSGRLLVGTSSARTTFYNGGTATELQVEGDGEFSVTRNYNDAFGGSVILAKTRSSGNTIVSTNDTLGNISFQGNDGTDFVDAARIYAEVDGTPGANDMPGRLVFSTTADGASSPTERMRISSGGFTKISNNGTFLDSAGTYHEVANTLDASTFIVSNFNASYTSVVSRVNATRAANSAYVFWDAYSGGFGDREYNLRGDGNAFADGTWSGGGADYAEYFEWTDSNPDAEDRRGISVVLDGDKIREAQPGEDPIGVISGNPSVVGDAAWNKWSGKYLRDEFGTYLLDGNGDRQLNPAYDLDQKYIPREQRPEWDCVGLMGKLRIRKGQVTGSRWIKMRDISDSVEEWLVR